MSLSDLSDELFIEAVGRCLKHCTFFPVPSEIRSHAQNILTEHGVLPSEPEPAWESVLNMARRWSPYQPSVEFEDQAIARTVQELGGIGRIAMAHNDEIPFLRRDFLARYSTYRQREIESGKDWYSRALTTADNAPAITSGGAK